MNVRNLDIQNESVRGITTSGIMVKAVLVNSSGTSTSADVDFSKSIIKVILNRGGRQYVILQSNLKILGLASNLDGLLQYAFAGGGFNIPSSLGSMQSFIIPFGGHINLKGDDFIYVEVQNLAGLFTSTIAATSFLDVRLIKSVGYEQFIPSITTMVIQANETTRNYDLGDNIIKACLLNYDKTDFTNNVVSNLTFSSDRLNENYTFMDLVTFKLSRYKTQLLGDTNPDLSSRINGDQCFTLIDFASTHGGIFQQVQFDINFNSAQVTAGNNYIVYWSYYTTPEILAKAANMEAKHLKKANDKVVSDAPKK